MAIIAESNRDNLLQPFVNIYNEKTGQKANVSQMKKYLLAKFTNEAYIRNLSLASNYYLVGVARYYFNGDLTTNKDLGVFTDGPDQFNQEICERLNALILILRNKYIDSVGTQFEQPEDFGNLTIQKLLRKYGAAINKELGVEFEKKKENQEVAPMDRHIGNGYTFDILHSFEDARKYHPYTEPGAWCITYLPHMFDSYIKRYGIHYVIFLKNGYENVPRRKGPNWTSRKPQDEYGNSMIALLQSNKDGEPIIITSRWNHGSGQDNSDCEADHAYTKEEFLRTVGITDADLKNIFKEWSREHPQESSDRKALNAERLTVLRQFKYAQMRLNGGDSNPFDDFKISKTLPMSNIEKLTNILSKYQAMIKNYRDQNGAGAITPEYKQEVEAQYNREREKVMKNGVRACEIELNTGTYYFLMDKSKILFDTIVKTGQYDSLKMHFSSSEDDTDSAGNGYSNIVLCKVVNGNMLYNTRLHEFVTVDGIKKFKYVKSPLGWKPQNGFYEVKMASNQIALIDRNTNRPLKLPNGSSWFEKLTTTDRYWTAEDTTCRYYETSQVDLFDIVFDSAAREEYYFDLATRKFVDFPKKEVNTAYGTDIVNARVQNIGDNNPFGIYGMGYRAWANCIYLYKAGEPLEINPEEGFEDAKYCGMNNFFLQFHNGTCFIYNIKTGEKYGSIEGTPIKGMLRGYGTEKQKVTGFRVQRGEYQAVNSDGYYRGNSDIDMYFDNRFNQWIPYPGKENEYDPFEKYNFNRNTAIASEGEFLYIWPESEHPWGGNRETYVLLDNEPKYIPQEEYREMKEREKNQAPAYSITESDMKYMVLECMRTLLKK